MSEFSKRYTGDKITPIEPYIESEDYKSLTEVLEGKDLEYFIEHNCQTYEHELNIEEIQLRRAKLPLPEQLVQTDWLPKKFVASDLRIQYQESYGEENLRSDWPYFMQFKTAHGYVEVRANDLHSEIVVFKNGEHSPIFSVSPTIAIELLDSILEQLQQDDGQEIDESTEQEEPENKFSEEVSSKMGEIANYEGNYDLTINTPIIELDEDTRIYLSSSYIEAASPSPEIQGMIGQSTTVNVVQTVSENSPDLTTSLGFTYIKYDDLPIDGKKVTSKNAYMFRKVIDSPLNKLNKFELFAESEMGSQIDQFEELDNWEENIQILNVAISALLTKPD